MAYAIVGILVLAFIAFVVLSAKSWHWSNIVFLALTFLAGLGAIVAMAQVLEARRSDMLELKKVREDLERVELQIETTVYGAGLRSEYAPDSLRGLSEQLNLELAGRGRVWRNGAIESKDANRVFKFTGERVQSPDNPAKMVDMLLYIYADRTYEEEIHPVSFVGTMRVASETANSVVLEPVFIADAQEYNSPSGTWTLFEKSPADQRDAYIRNADIEIVVDAPDLNEKLTAYRKVLTEQFIPPQVFDLDLGNDEQAREYENIVDRIMFDGLPLVKIESWIESQTDRIAQRFDPSNEEVFVRYKFNDKSNRAYQVDSSGNIESDGQFTKNGQAIDPALHAGGEIEFQKGDEIVVDQLTAEGYQRGDEPVSPFSQTEPVTEISRVYFRQLNDYPFLLETLQRKAKETETEIARTQENNRRSQLAIADSDQQEQQRREFAQKLLEDQAKFQGDVETVQKFADDTLMQKSDIESSISQLESDIREQHRKIKAIAQAIRELSTGTVSQPNVPIETIDSIAPGE